MNIIATIVMLLFSVSVHADLIASYDGKPITVALQVEQERILQFEEPVFVGVPSGLQTTLRIQSSKGHVYLKASTPFEPIRIQVKLAGSGELVLLDVTAVAAEPDNPDLAETVLIQLDNQPQLFQSHSELDPRVAPMTAIEMMRFASHQFYAPPRLRLSDHRMRQVGSRTKALPTLFNGSMFGIYQAQLSAVWTTADGRYLSAVKLVNSTPFTQPILFDKINADFSYASPQHIDVKPSGTAGDVTMLYIIGSAPIDQLLYL